MFAKMLVMSSMIFSDQGLHDLEFEFRSEFRSEFPF